MIKRGQVTIFIIVAVVLVVLIGLIILFMTDIENPFVDGNEINPNIFLESCLEDTVKDATKLIMKQGGYVHPEISTNFKFDEEPSHIDIAYLCYSEYPKGVCTILEGDLLGHLRDELTSHISDDVDTCFHELGELKGEEGYNVNANYQPGDFEVTILAKKIIVDIDGSLTLTKSKKTTKAENFRVIYGSRYYDLAIVTQDILWDLVRNNCEIDNLDYITPKIMVDMPHKLTQGKDFIEFYKITDKDTNEVFRFGVKNCLGN